MAAIAPDPEYIDQLQSMAHSTAKLKLKGFSLQPLSHDELSKKLRCVRCNKRAPKKKKKKPYVPEVKKPLEGSKDGPGAKKENTPTDTSPAGFDGEKLPATAPTVPKGGGKNGPDKDGAEKPRKPVCQWHAGRLRHKSWTCCRGHLFAPGCKSTTEHSIPTAVTPATIWRYQIQPSPAPDPNNPKYIAVAIDCEMGQAKDGNSELIRVTVIDYFTATPLLDTLVRPTVPIADYATRYSGITAAALSAAERQGNIIHGTDAARAAVFNLVDANTIVIGHDVRNDFDALRWAHGGGDGPRVVVDSMLVEAGAREHAEKARAWAAGARERAREDAAGRLDGAADGEEEVVVEDEEEDAGEDGVEQKEEEKPKGPGLRLKDVTMDLIGRVIQRGSHDSYEDALASRDIVHYHVLAKMAAAADVQDGWSS